MFSPESVLEWFDIKDCLKEENNINSFIFALKTIHSHKEAILNYFNNQSANASV